MATQRSTVLFLAANPIEQQRLQLDDECRTIEDTIRGAKFSGQIHFRSRWAVRPDDLLQALNEDSPSVLHFSGHGAGHQGLCFQAEDGSTRSVTADALAGVMRAAGSSVAVVLLNACYSEVQAKALVDHVPCVIGTPDAIGDKAATKYSSAFYRALAFGESVAKAHQQGIAALALLPMKEQTRDIMLSKMNDCVSNPQLLTRRDTNANLVYIVQKPKKTRCTIVFKATLSEFNAEVISRVRDELIRWTGDLSLQIDEIADGSVLMTIALSHEGARMLTEAKTKRQSLRFCGFEVIDVLASRETEPPHAEPTVNPLSLPRKAMTDSSQDLTWMYNSVMDLIEEIVPDELDYFEANGRQIVAALAAGEDVRKTFNVQRVYGDAGAGGLAHLAEVITSLRLAWSTYKMYKALRGYLASPAPPPSSLMDGIIQELVSDGYPFDEARRIAIKTAAVIRKRIGE